MTGSVSRLHVFLQPENQDQLRGHGDEGHVKNGVEPEFFHQCAAAEQRQRIGGGPDNVVSTHHARQADGVLAFTHERLDGWPDETHADVEQSGGQHQSGDGGQPADGQRGNHHPEADLERVEIAASLAETAPLPRGKHINEAVQRGKGEVVPAIEAELAPHEKIDVIGIKRHREGAQSFHGETNGFELAAAPGHHVRLEISRIAARQYHFTASDIGGSSLSKSAAEHQRMS